jgi:hypothetical protein
MADKLTVLTTAPSRPGDPQPILAKQWRLDKEAEIEGVSYDSAYLFWVSHESFDSLHGLFELLKSLANRQHVCVIRGHIDPSPKPVRRLLYDDGNTKATITRQDLSAICVDVDGWELPDDLEPGEEKAAEWVRSQLPIFLRACSCIYQWSGSAGFKPGAKIHLWFYGDRPVCDDSLTKYWKEWNENNPQRTVDAALYRPAQVHYTSNPVIGEGVADPIVARIGRLGGTAQVIFPRDILSLADEEIRIGLMKAVAAAQRKQRLDEAKARMPSLDPDSIKRRTADRVETAISYARDRILSAGDGNRHRTFSAMARFLGGFIAHYQVSADRLVNELTDIAHIAYSGEAKRVPDEVRNIREHVEVGEQQPWPLEAIAENVPLHGRALIIPQPEVREPEPEEVAKASPEAAPVRPTKKRARRFVPYVETCSGFDATKEPFTFGALLPVSTGCQTFGPRGDSIMVPRMYSVTEQGGVSRWKVTKTTSADGETSSVPEKALDVFPVPVVITGKGIGVRGDVYVVIRSKVKKMWMTHAISVKRAGTIKAIADELGVVSFHEKKSTKEAWNQYVMDAMKDAPDAPIADAFGWLPGGFLCGRTFIHNDGTQLRLGVEDGIDQPVAIATGGGMREAMVGDGQAGSLEVWVQGMQLIQPYRAAAVFVLASFVSPLLFAFGLPGIVISLAAPSTSGKTVTLGGSESIWGKPGDNGLRWQWSATAAAIEICMKSRRHVPVFLDDTHQSSEARFKSTKIPDTVYAAANGKVRARCTPTGELTESSFGNFQLALLTTGEDPISEKLEGGGRTRLIEFDEQPFGDGKNPIVPQIEAMLKDNYGYAGPAFISWFMRNRGENMPKWKEWLIQRTAEHGKGMNRAVARMADRWALLELVAMMVKEAIGLDLSPRIDMEGGSVDSWDERAGVASAHSEDMHRAKDAALLIWSYAAQNRALIHGFPGLPEPGKDIIGKYMPNGRPSIAIIGKAAKDIIHKADRIYTRELPAWWAKNGLLAYSNPENGRERYTTRINVGGVLMHCYEFKISAMEQLLGGGILADTVKKDGDVPF